MDGAVRSICLFQVVLLQHAQKQLIRRELRDISHSVIESEVAFRALSVGEDACCMTWQLVWGAAFAKGVPARQHQWTMLL